MINELIERYPSLISCKEEIEKTIEKIIKCYENGGKLLICGNGGSCADADHISGELMKGFLKKRPLSDEQVSLMQKNNPQISDELLSKLQNPLTAIPLHPFAALSSAYANDVDPSLIYAQAVFGLGKKDDIIICISTSGNAGNVFSAANVAKALGLTVIGLTGEKGGKLKEFADICIRVPESETFKIQEFHLPVYHCICAAVEAYFFKE